ncbi:uncharacterized protein LOC123300830 [Chrysoperla carnea]|uniref:uncharacterized protein LOC123300830 n=1 Tax=Chrysoperla carnea TaxID=189513 RepID=UPI001D06F746|nr:uncharacterized protein LOC123300830 [Chrysoperla carnea]
MNLNFVLSLSIVVVLISTTFGKTYLEGVKGDEDKLLYRRFVKAAGTPLGHAYREIVYPEKGESGGPIITCINATDLSRPTSKKGGKVNLFLGGVNKTFAVLDFKSALSRGLDFDVKIYGH